MGKMKSIWYFVGWVLMTMGTIIFLTGLYIWLAGLPGQTVLHYLHPNIWWGGLMILSGILFFLYKDHSGD